MGYDRFAYLPAPAANPLKGFVPYAENPRAKGTLDASLEWFYLPLRDLCPKKGLFDWESLEKALNRTSYKGRQAAFRIVLDHPGTPIATPQWMIEAGVLMRPYKEHGGGQSPDYQNRLVIDTLEAFISALGEKYDGDPRIGYITAGLLGFWGEWHTWPHDDWFAPSAIQERVVTAYSKAFKVTPVLLRNGRTGASARGFGYHDDSFAHTTLPGESWHFLQQLKSTRQLDAWTTAPIGGEVRPELQPHIVANTQHHTLRHEKFDSCVKDAHPTWLLFEEAFNTQDPKQIKHLEHLAASLGYEYQITGADLSYNKTTFDCSLTINNRGVAPFYGDWTIDLILTSLVDGTNHIHRTDWSPRGVQPGVPRKFSTHWNVPQLHNGTWTVSIRINNPLTGGRPFIFANNGADTPDGRFVIGDLNN